MKKKKEELGLLPPKKEFFLSTLSIGLIVGTQLYYKEDIWILPWWGWLLVYVVYLFYFVKRLENEKAAKAAEEQRKQGHQPTPWDDANELMNHLGCECKYFPPMPGTYWPILDAWYDARTRAEQEGYTPVIVVLSELLMENLFYNPETEMTPVQWLDIELPDAKQWLDERLAETMALHDELYEDEDEREFARKNLIGEIDEGYERHRYDVLWDERIGYSRPAVLAKLPTKNPWSIFAWLPYGGWNDCPSNEYHMAVARRWYEKYGAVPMIMGEDILEFNLKKAVPKEDLMELALEHYAYCSDIVDQGTVTVGTLAGVLGVNRRWTFWWD